MNKASAVTIALLVGVGIGSLGRGPSPAQRRLSTAGQSRGAPSLTQPVSAGPVRAKYVNGVFGPEVSWQCDVTNNSTQDREVFLEVKFKDSGGFEQTHDLESRTVAAGKTVTYSGRRPVPDGPIDLAKAEAVID